MKIDFDHNLKEMIEDQIIRRGITDERVIHAMQIVPRHQFIPDDYIPYAYSDGPVPIGFGQTISQPYIVALMTSELHLKGEEKVLEVGTGCGYQTAILAHLARKIVSIEIIPDLADGAVKLIEQLHLKNITVIKGDGSSGFPEEAPYDAILISAAAPKVPDPILGQLAEGGRLILPVGIKGFQHLEIWCRVKDGYSMEKSLPVAFVPLRGKYGWSD
jgi:protein-L-isoaspartate(D-aspartate) O-methyltransferase